ncbi:MAG: hypothetical protein WCK78_06605 [Paludibacter sp.]
MKHFNKLSDQLKNSKLTVKYSEANGSELACIWEDNSDDESLLVINRIKVHGDEIIQHTDKDNNIRETLMKDFLNPKNDDDSQTILKQNLNEIVNRTYEKFDKFVKERRGSIAGKKFGF